MFFLYFPFFIYFHFFSFLFLFLLLLAFNQKLLISFPFLKWNHSISINISLLNILLNNIVNILVPASLLFSLHCAGEHRLKFCSIQNPIFIGINHLKSSFHFTKILHRQLRSSFRKVWNGSSSICVVSTHFVNLSLWVSIYLLFFDQELRLLRAMVNIGFVDFFRLLAIFGFI